MAKALESRNPLAELIELAQQNQDIDTISGPEYYDLDTDSLLRTQIPEMRRLGLIK